MLSGRWGILMLCGLAQAIWTADERWILSIQPESGDERYLNGFFFAVITHPDSFEQREAARRSWIPRFTSRGAQYRFFVGGVNLNQSSLWRDAGYNDIVHLPFVESYANLSRKTEAAAAWATAVTNPQYFVKIDDDVYPSSSMFHQLLPILPKQGLYLGKMIHHSPAVHDRRGKHGKWAIDRRLFSGDWYPDYAEGPMYILSNDAMSILGRAFDPLQRDEDVFPSEDINTALILQKANIFPVSVSRDGKFLARSGPFFFRGPHSFMLSDHKGDRKAWGVRACTEDIVAYHSIPAEQMMRVGKAEDEFGLSGMIRELCGNTPANMTKQNDGAWSV